jgi:UDP-2-acetamido-3-amino-2,3-dideoxy-glucuronate N-acetyltransferase
MSNGGQVAVVGCGYWGKNLIRNFAQLGVLRLICDSNEKSLQTQAALYSHVHATESFEQVLTDPNAHGVVLATPAVMHFEQVKKALNAGWPTE